MDDYNDLSKLINKDDEVEMEVCKCNKNYSDTESIPYSENTYENYYKPYKTNLSEANRLSETNRLKDANRVSEANRLNKANRVSEANRLSETNRLKDANQVSEANRLNKANRVSEANRLKDANRVSEENKYKNERIIIQMPQIELNKQNKNCCGLITYAWVSLMFFCICVIVCFTLLKLYDKI